MRKIALAALLATVTACASENKSSSGKRTTRYATGVEVFKVEGLVQVEIEEVWVRKHRIHVKLAVKNLSDKPLHFLRSACYLDYSGAQVQPIENSTGWGWRGEEDINLGAGKQKRKHYHFDVAEKRASPAAGEYDVVFSGFYTFETGSGGKSPIADELKFKLKVP